jgi:hypothetical protein
MRHHDVRAAAQHALLGGGRASGAADLDWSRSRGNQAGQELRPTFETLKTVYFETAFSAARAWSIWSYA